MKVTKYPQSCLIIEKEGKRLVIDPGTLVSEKYRASDLLPVDAILITHEHSDHIDPKLIIDMTKGTTIPVIGNQSTADIFKDVVTKVVTDKEEFELLGFKITVRELPHVAMVDGSEGPQNSGFIIDNVFFHPGDGTHINNLTVHAAAVPLAGPDVSPRDVYSFINEIQCEMVIPIHYDYYPADPQFYERLILSHKPNIKYIPLANGESAEV